MKSMHELLDDAEKEWREEVRHDFPLRSDTPVVRNTKPNGRDWLFATDLKSIFAHISNDEGLQKKFKDIIGKYWSGNPEEIALETMHYLLFHELYHPLEAPFSVSGPDNDNKKIHQAMRRGIIKAQSNLSPIEQIMKVQMTENGVKDFILDNRFAVDNKVKEYVRDDIIPTWDMLELQEAPAKTNFYTVTRLLYGLLYGPESIHEFFEQKSGKDGRVVAEKALGALLEKKVSLPTKNPSLIGKVKSLFSSKEDFPSEQLQGYVDAIREVFSGKDRYDGIERFMTVLGPYIEKGMPQVRPDMQGGIGGGSPQSILQDLLDDMTAQEQSEFLEEMVKTGEGELDRAEMQVGAMGQENASSNAEMAKNLDVLAAHEFYKRMHPKVTIIGGNKVGESVVIGKQEYWDLKKSQVLTEDQLSRINLQRIDLLQRRTRLPWLMDLGNGTFRLNEYELKERQLKDIVYVDAHLDVPDVVEFYLDSSGSMFSGRGIGEFKVNDGTSWDMLSHVLYGFVDALQQGGKQLGKQSKMRIHNFANKQISSQLIPVERFWNGDVDALRILFKPENGYDVEEISIKEHNDGQRRAYVVVTDGNLVLQGRTEREATKMKHLANNPKNSVLLFEIGGTYGLGRAVQNIPGIAYHPVHDKDKMLKAGLEVLLSK